MNANIDETSEEEGCLILRVGGIAVGSVKIINVWSGGVDVRLGDRVVTLPSFVLDDN